MFKRVKAEPNGNITFIYSDYTMKIDRNGISQIKSTLFEKGYNERISNLYISSDKHRNN